MEYFSDRENGPLPRTVESIPGNVKEGIFSHIDSLIESGAFSCKFPEYCTDINGIVGTNNAAFFKAVAVEIPGLSRKRNQWFLDGEGGFQQELKFFDFIEFCFHYVEKPAEEWYHDYLRHYHLSFDAAEGKKEFQETINRFFSRNHLAYELSKQGQITRLGPPVLRDELAASVFNTGDSQLDALLEECRTKHFKADPVLRHEALERLWDCWERLKTLENSDKKKSISAIIQQSADCEDFRKLLNAEAETLTKIGNEFQIRHFEVSKIPVQDPDHVDYLFSRMFSLIFLLLKKRNALETRSQPTETSDEDIPF